MTTFDDRERAFENRFAHDQELAFKAEARRAKQIALWAAALLGKAPAEADAYTQSLLTLTVTGGGTAALVARLKQDFDAGGVVMTEHQIHRELNDAMSHAIEQLMIE
jgi:hypothetical protein